MDKAWDQSFELPAVMHMLCCAALAKEEPSLNVKLPIYQSLTSGSKIWVVTKRIRSWLKAAVICFRYRMSGHTLQAKTLPTEIPKHRKSELCKDLLQLDYAVVPFLSGQTKTFSMSHTVSFRFKLEGHHLWQWGVVEQDALLFTLSQQLTRLLLYHPSEDKWYRRVIQKEAEPSLTGTQHKGNWPETWLASQMNSW